MREPPVKLLIRKGGHGNYEWREEKEWPLARTRWTKFYLEPRPSAAERRKDRSSQSRQKNPARSPTGKRDEQGGRRLRS